MGKNHTAFHVGACPPIQAPKIINPKSFPLKSVSVWTGRWHGKHMPGSDALLGVKDAQIQFALAGILNRQIWPCGELEPRKTPFNGIM